MNISISLDQSKLRKKGHPIVLSIFISKTDRAYPALNYYSFSKDWDFQKNIPKKTHPQFNIISTYIYELNLKINKIQISDRKKTAKQIQNLILGNYECIYAFWEERIEEEKQLLENKKIEVHSGGNAYVYKTCLSVWKNFKATLLYEDITYDMLTRFKREKSETCNAGGINYYIKTLRAIYNEAVKRGIYTPENSISPFNNIMEVSSKTKDKFLSIDEMKIVFANKNEHHFYQFFKLCFLLGGLDFIDIASLEKSHLKNGRLKFERFKGNTKEQIDNFIFPEALEILKKFDNPESKFLLPIHQYSYKPYRDKSVRKMREFLEEIEITSYADSKTPRYSFIQIGSKELYLNRDIVKEIVGHSNNDTHAIYEGKFPVKIKDEVHRKIIDSVLEITAPIYLSDAEYIDLA